MSCKQAEMPLSVPWDPSNQVRPSASRGQSSGLPSCLSVSGSRPEGDRMQCCASGRGQLAEGLPVSLCGKREPRP